MKALDKHSTSDWHSFIAPIANRLMDFSNRNPLLNLNQKSGIVPVDIEIENELDQFKLELGNEIKKLIKKKQRIQKEIGLNTLYLSWGVYEIQNEEMGQLPFYLIPIDTKFNKDKSEITILPNWEEKVINPLLIRILKEKFNLEAKEDAVSAWEAHLGIFNYKKYVLLDEISKMDQNILSNPIRELFDFNPEKQNTEATRFSLDSALIVEADPSQREIIQKSLTGDSFCVQGPPGTGKSQTITNIIAANLKLDKKILFVSEKKAAIDVVHDKLKKSGLGSSLTQITDSGNDKKDFIQSLSTQWEKNKDSSKKENRFSDFSNSYSKVERFLDHLFRFQTDLGMTLNDALAKYPLDLKAGKDEAPTLEQWINIKDFVLFLFDEMNKENIQSSDLASLLKMNSNLFTVPELEEKINLHSQILLDNIAYIPDTKLSISELQRECIQARVICGLLYKEKLEILKNSSQQKKFQTESKRYYKLKNEIENLQIDIKAWKNIPDRNTLEFWRNHLNSKGWFNSNKRKAQQSLNEHLHSPVENLEVLFLSTEKYNDTEKKWNTCKTKLKTEFQISDPEREIDELNLILNKMDHQKSTFDFLLEKNMEEIAELDTLNPILDKIIHSRKVLFSSGFKSVEDLLVAVNTAQRNRDFIVRNKEVFKGLKKISSDTIPFLIDHSKSDNIEELVYKSNVSKTILRSVILSEMNPKELNSLIRDIQKKRKSNQPLVSADIAEQLKKDFNDLEELLITPAGRLDSDEKELKKSVRSGKRILTHEFSKTRSYKAIRELCELDSKHWVFKMKKVWMMNPLSVSEILPFEKEQFDLLVIDEASQIPEEDIIPSLFRAKQVIIVGDKMQMPPSNYFSGNEVGPSILDTAHFRLPNEMLKWHYRSQNPELIAFSNHAFYDSQLIVNPSVGLDNESMNFHFVEKSNYSEGSNSKEAEAIVDFLSVKNKEWKGQIGIGCFSLAQQKTLEKIIEKKPDLLERIQNETLFIRNLENLQGDECDHLIISIGYGPDKDGKLKLNFGPLSKNGGHNRLNVLITRARISVDLFASFKAEELKLSENEGINYLKEYMHFVQNPKNDLNWNDLEIDQTKKSAILNITESVDIETLLSRFNVLTENGFKVELKTRLN